MKCLHCGHCCIHLWILTVDDPDKGFEDENIITQGNGIPCKHLIGNKPGEYICAIHEHPIYKQTGCYRYTQIESNPENPCRTGKYIMDNPDLSERLNRDAIELLNSLKVNEGVLSNESVNN